MIVRIFSNYIIIQNILEIYKNLFFKIKEKDIDIKLIKRTNIKKINILFYKENLNLNIFIKIFYDSVFWILGYNLLAKYLKIQFYVAPKTKNNYHQNL